MNKFFIPRAAMGQADEVVGTILESEPDGSRATGKAICEYVAKIDADALVLMRMQKSSLDRFLIRNGVLREALPQASHHRAAAFLLNSKMPSFKSGARER